MMIQPTDKMRRLTERWLDGYASAAEEAELLQLLDAAADLPADLADQRRLMHALRAAAPEPAVLTEETAVEFSAFVSELAAADVRRSRWRSPSVWMRATAAAVVVLLLGATGWGLAEHYGEPNMHLAAADTASIAVGGITPASAINSVEKQQDGQSAIRLTEDEAAIAKAREEAAAAAAARERRQRRIEAERAIGEAQSVINDLNVSMSTTSRQLESVSERLADRTGILTADDPAPATEENFNN